jgi:ketosteroid isomerase-like protein
MNIDQVAQTYQQLNKKNLEILSQIYHQDVVFEDAAHKLNGWDELQLYFENLYQNVDECYFDIQSQYQDGDSGFLVWVMHLRHPKLKSGQPVMVNGISHIRFQDGKVIHHRDYFDMGEMLYENLPLLGSVVKGIKKRLGQ